ncbi:MAG: hypothetical protein AAF789_12245, partial [Bacteroidota bacterium]
SRSTDRASAMENYHVLERIGEGSGAEVLIEGSLGESRVIYVDPGPGAGSLVEILQPSPESPALFEMIKQAGIGWDGREPLRKLG